MKQMTVSMEDASPETLELGCEALLAELKRRRVKRSVAPPITCEYPKAGNISRGPYAFRYVEALVWSSFYGPRMLGRMDTLYGKGVK